MPIKGITGTGIGFPEIGRIRLGAPKTDKGGVGKDLDYFRIELDENDEDYKRSQERLLAAYGPTPKNLNIVLPFDEIERCWDANYEAYTASQAVAIADGEFFQFLRDPQTAEVLVKDGKDKDGNPVPCDITQPVGYYKKKFKTTDDKGKEKIIEKDEPIYLEPYGRLRVMLPVLNRLAHFTMVTSSVNNIRNIEAQLNMLKYVNRGKLIGIPMILRRRQHKITIPPKKKGDKPSRVTKWLVSIEADPRWVENMIGAGAFEQIPEELRLQLPAGQSAVIESTFTPLQIEGGTDEVPATAQQAAAKQAIQQTQQNVQPDKKKINQEAIQLFFNAAYTIADMDTAKANAYLKSRNGDYEKAYKDLVDEFGDKEGA